MAKSTIWSVDEFKPLAGRWMARQRELALRAAYYDGSIYANMNGMLGWLAPRVFGNIKPLYLPLSRAVDVDAGIVPGGWSFPDGSPAAWESARERLFAWSHWDSQGALYVHYGAVHGVSGLKVCDLRDAGRVIIQPVNPQTFMLVRAGQYDPTPRMAIIVETRTDAAGDDFEYAEVIEPERVRTFADGVPTGFDGRDPEYPNDLGVVPLVEVQHIATGDELGECTYQKVIPLLDVLNEEATRLSVIIRKHAEPQWAVIGAEPGDLAKSGDAVWFIPGGGDAKALVANVDIGGVLKFVQEISANVTAGLPELAFDDLRRATQIATATIELQLMELTLKVKRVRPNYDAGLVRAMQIAGAAAAQMGVGEIAPLGDENLRLDNERRVIPLDEGQMLAQQQGQINVAMSRIQMQREAQYGLPNATPAGA